MQNAKEKWTARLIKGLVFFFPLCFGVVESWHSTILVGLVVLSLFYCWGQWSRTEKEVKRILFAFLVFFAVISLSLINSADFYESQKKVVKLFYLLGLFPLLLASMRLKLDLARYYISGAMVGSVVMYGMALYQVYFSGIGRAHGATNPIIFGAIAMLQGFLIFGFILATPDCRRWVAPAMISMFCAFSASLMSLTRGAWVAVPFLLILLLLIFGRKAKASSIAATSLLLIVLFVGSGVIHGDKFSYQIERTVQSIEDFLEGSNRNSSTGQRFLMWGIAVEMFKENPVLGSGVADFPHDAAHMMEEGTTDLKRAHPHAHSIFFEFLGTTGLAGLTAMTLAVLILPFRYFYRKWQAASRENRRSAVCGMILIFSFFVFGLTESWLSRSPFVSVYVVGLFAFFSTYLRPERNERREKI